MGPPLPRTFSWPVAPRRWRWLASICPPLGLPRPAGALWRPGIARRTPCTRLWRSSCITPARHAPLSMTSGAPKSTPEWTPLLLEESDAPAVLMAMSGALEPTANSPDTLTLLGELALAAYDGQRAAGYAQQALERDPKDPAALRVLARAYVVRGDAPQAVATARQAKAHDGT